MALDPACHGSDEIDLLAERYLHAAGGNALAALRSALKDALRDAIDARLRILELERAASPGFLRGPLPRAAADRDPARALG